MKNRYSVEKCLKLVLQMNAQLDIGQTKRIFAYLLSTKLKITRKKTYVYMDRRLQQIKYALVQVETTVC